MNKLEHLAEFQQALANYKISEEAHKILAATRMALMVGPTSAGQNTITRELIQTGRYYYVVSDTTREPRVNNGVKEENGKVYWFKDEQSMLAGIKRGEYIAPAIIHNQQVSGMSLRELARANYEDKIATTDIDPVGVRSIIQVKPDAQAFFLLPPSFEEWLRRIQSRGGITEGEIRRRLESAIDQFADSLERSYYHFIINDSVSDAVQQIEQVVKLSQLNDAVQTHGRQLAKTLLLETQKYVSSNKPL